MITTLLSVLVSAALAQEAQVFEKPEAAGQEFEEPEGHLAAEVGGSATGGNTQSIQVNAGAKGDYKKEQNMVRGSATALYGTAKADADADGTLSEDERQAEFVPSAGRYEGDLRYDRFIGENNSLYLSSGALRDTFAGYEVRLNEQVGYSRLLVNRDQVSLRVELGADFAEEWYVIPVDDAATTDLNEATEAPAFGWLLAARAMTGIAWKINDSVNLTEEVEVFEALVRGGDLADESGAVDFSDLRLVNTVGLNVKLSDKFGLKVSHDLAFDNQPVSEDYAKLDQTVKVTLVASIF